MIPKTTSKTAIKTVMELVSLFHVEHWDVLVIGDGAGSGWERSMGWAGCLLDRYRGEWKTIVGGQYTGTIYLAEIMALLAPLQWMAANQKLRPLTKAHCFTDNESVYQLIELDQGREEYRHLVKLVRDLGYELHAHSIPRDQVAAHVLMDELSATARQYMEAFDQGVIDVPSAFPYT